MNKEKDSTNTYSFCTDEPFISCTFEAYNKDYAIEFYKWYAAKHNCRHASLYRGKRPTTSGVDIIYWQETNRVISNGGLR